MNNGVMSTFGVKKLQVGLRPLVSVLRGISLDILEEVRVSLRSLVSILGGSSLNVLDDF